LLICLLISLPEAIIIKAYIDILVIGAIGSEIICYIVGKMGIVQYKNTNKAIKLTKGQCFQVVTLGTLYEIAIRKNKL